jgi:hypothetical protein
MYVKISAAALFEIAKIKSLYMSMKKRIEKRVLLLCYLGAGDGPRASCMLSTVSAELCPQPQQTVLIHPVEHQICMYQQGLNPKVIIMEGSTHCKKGRYGQIMCLEMIKPQDDANC